MWMERSTYEFEDTTYTGTMRDRFLKLQLLSSYDI